MSNRPAQRILVVDDEQDILELLQYNLVKEGYEVRTASDVWLPWRRPRLFCLT